MGISLDKAANMKNDKVCEVSMSEMFALIEEQISAGGSVELTVTGNSMYPMLKHKKSVVRLSGAWELKIGDIPLYRRDNGVYVLHRIVRTADTYTCCGDNQWRLEHGIRRDQIIAVVTDYKRSKRWRSCTSRGYLLYVRFWTWIRPLRRLIFGGWKRLCRLIKLK